MIKKLLTTLCLCLVASMSATYANDEIKSIVFLGRAGQEKLLDITKYNRITFGQDTMTISSSHDSGQEEINLLYTLYHHIELGTAVPSAIEDVDADATQSSLIFDSNTKTMRLNSRNTGQFTLGVFDIKGVLLKSVRIFGGDEISLQNLSPGVYITVATDSKTNLKLKFVIR